jgi:hypothetical protein
VNRISRRNFVRGAAAGTVAVAAAGDLVDYALPKTSAASPPTATIEVMNPIADVLVERVPPATRLTDLNNKRILLGMQKGNADIAVQRVQELFQQRYKGQQFLQFRFPGNMPLTKAQIDEIQKWKPDAIFVTNGD